MRAADADILIVPGVENSGPEHWQSRWQDRLSTARRVNQEDWNAPKRDGWVSTLKRAIEQSQRPVVVVAHSLGVITFLHAAQSASDKIAGAFLVAPPSDRVLLEFPSVDSNFLPIPRARLPFPSVLIAGSDDPYAEAGFAEALAADIGARFIDAGAVGHINVASGHGPWPEGSMTFAHFISKL